MAHEHFDLLKIWFTVLGIYLAPLSICIEGSPSGFRVIFQWSTVKSLTPNVKTTEYG